MATYGSKQQKSPQSDGVQKKSSGESSGAGRSEGVRSTQGYSAQQLMLKPSMDRSDPRLAKLSPDMRQLAEQMEPEQIESALEDLTPEEMKQLESGDQVGAEPLDQVSVAPGATVQAKASSSPQVQKKGSPAAKATGGEADPIVAAVNSKNFSTALRLGAAKPADSIKALEAAGKVDAFFDVIKKGKPYTTVQRTRMNTLYKGLSLANKLKLFSARYSIRIDETAKAFSETELDTLYEQAALLPPNHVEGMGKFKTLKRTLDTATAGGSYGGGTIKMRDQKNKAKYAQTFRHEVGHAVDDMLGAKCQQFRTDSSKGGWKRYAGTDAFVTAAGGYGTIPADLKATVKSALDTFKADGGPWKVPTDSFAVHLERAVSAKHGGDAGKTKTDFDKLKALFGSNTVLDTANNLPAGSYFYGSSAVGKWATKGSNAYFINFYYDAFFSVSTTTHSDLSSWGNSSACFSDKEWFAEIYAEYYKSSTPNSGRTFPAFINTFMGNDVQKLGQAATPSPESPKGGGHPQVPRA